MHELAIAESIVNIALREIEQKSITTVQSAGVRIGAISGVNPSALEFSFEAIIVNTPLSGAKLKVEEIPAGGICRACKTAFEVTEFIFVCPHCFSGDLEINQGQELDIAYLETE